MKMPWQNQKPQQNNDANTRPLPVSQLRERVDWAEERKNIHESIGDDDAIQMLCADADDTILYDVPSGRELRFRLTPHTESSIREILHVGHSMNIKPEQLDILIGHVISLEPELLMNIRGIIIVDRYSDLVQITRNLDIEESEIPDKLQGNEENTISDDVIGLHWYVQSMVVINIHAMRKTASELCEDGILAYDDEMRIGFWTTLLHELRHNQVEACIYEVPWLKESDAIEGNIEQWAREKYEATFGK